MFKFTILLLLSWRVQGNAINEADTRIVGGRDAPNGIAPYQISMRTMRMSPQEYHFCGGSIINKNWVLTAAHCTVGVKPEEIKVVVGTNYLRYGGDRYNVSKIVNHEKYVAKTLKNDISVMKIDGEITFGYRVKAINLASNDTEVGTKCLLTGWGYRNEYRSVPDRLQMLFVKTLSLEKCNKDIPQNIEYTPVDDNQICTFASQRQGGCQGDSGGPLVCKNELVGVVSWGVPCARGYPDVFASVYAYRDWINDKITQ